MTALNLLTADDLQEYMLTHDIPGEIIHLDVPTPTVETAAQAVGCAPEQIVKSILFLVDTAPRLAVTSGLRRVETRALAARYGVGRKHVKLADTDTVLEIAGYEVGAMPPFGHRTQLETLFDPRVLDHAEVYAGGGAGNALLRISPQDILKFTQADVIDLHNVPTATG